MWTATKANVHVRTSEVQSARECFDERDCDIWVFAQEPVPFATPVGLKPLGCLSRACTCPSGGLSSGFGSARLEKAQGPAHGSDRPHAYQSGPKLWFPSEPSLHYTSTLVRR